MFDLFQFVRQRLGMLSRYSALQIFLQAVNALTGFLLIRSMDKQNYAWFTVAFGGQAALGVLADCGLTSSLTTLGGPICNQYSRLSGLVNHIRRLRRKFMIAASVVIVPSTWWLLHENSASLSQAIIVVALVVLSGYAVIDTLVLSTANKLSGHLPVVLFADSVFGMSRLVLVLAMFVTGTNAVSALACTAAAYLMQLGYLRLTTNRIMGNSNFYDPNWGASIRSHVKHLMPIGIWHCVQGQISTMILTIFATTGRVAEIGALSRFGFVFGLLMLPAGHFVFPSIARCGDQQRLRKLVFGTLAGYGALSLGIVLVGCISAQYFLLLLGPNYQHLEFEFGCYLAATALAMMSHLFWGFAMARGWVRYGWVEIPMTIAIQAISAPLLDFSKVSTAIGFVALGSVVHLVVGIVLIGRGLRSAHVEERGETEELGEPQELGVLL